MEMSYIAERIERIIDNTFLKANTEITKKLINAGNYKRIIVKPEFANNYGEEIEVQIHMVDNKDTPLIQADRGHLPTLSTSMIKLTFSKADTLKHEEELKIFRKALPGLLLAFDNNN